MITVSKQSWHAKVYLAWYQKKYGYTDSDILTNLCPYMRIILFWAPLRFLLGNWFTVPANITIKGKPYSILIPHGLITAPIAWIAVIKLIGYVSYDLKMGLFFITAICTLIILAAVFFITVHTVLDDAVTVNRVMSFIALTSEWIKSKHNKICPSIDIK